MLFLVLEQFVRIWRFDVEIGADILVWQRGFAVACESEARNIKLFVLSLLHPLLLSIIYYNLLSLRPKRLDSYAEQPNFASDWALLDEKA